MTENLSNFKKQVDELAVTLDEAKHDVARLQKTLRSRGELFEISSMMVGTILSEHKEFEARLRKYLLEKVDLAKFMASRFNTDTSDTIFLESGSTGAWLAWRFRKKADVYKKLLANKMFVTNNTICSVLLDNLAPVWQMEGWRESKYSGVFSFRSKREQARREKTGLEFDTLHERFGSAELDRLVLNASTFSFIIGPSVNGWQNALFKAVAYNVKKPIDVALPFGKLITNLGEPSDGKMKGPMNSLYWHLSNCFAVFSLPEEDEGAYKGKILPDLEALGEERSAMGYMGRKPFKLGYARTWLELCQRQKSDLRIWIACREETRDHKKLMAHIEDVNKQLQHIKAGFLWGGVLKQTYKSRNCLIEGFSPQPIDSTKSLPTIINLEPKTKAAV